MAKALNTSWPYSNLLAKKPLQLLFKFELSIVSRSHALSISFDVSHKFVAHEREDGVSNRQALRAHSSPARAGRGAIECAIKETLSAATSLENLKL